MNYLAHSYLSFTDGELVGNMIADYIKNNERANFPEEIQKGIVLHRAIDSFTDEHPEVSEAKRIFQPLVRLYSGAFVDVSFDYFLANSLSEKDLELHARKVYAVLWRYEEFLPENFRRILFAMEKDDWLSNYRFEWGIKFSIRNVLNKAKYLNEDLHVFEVFHHNRNHLKLHFDRFFPQLQEHAHSVHKKLCSD